MVATSLGVLLFCVMALPMKCALLSWMSAFLFLNDFSYPVYSQHSQHGGSRSAGRGTNPWVSALPSHIVEVQPEQYTGLLLSGSGRLFL